MITTKTISKEFDLLLKAQKATDRYLYQYDLCISIKEGTCRKLHDSTFEEELEILRKRKAWAKRAILNLQSAVRVLDKFYNLSSEREVRDMIFDFSQMVDTFLYNSELKEAEAI